MSFPQIPPQSSFLYSDGWNAEIDKFLLQSLISYKSEHKWDGTDIPNDAISATRAALNNFHATNFSFQQVLQRISVMEQRYSTFKSITTNPRCRYYHGDDFVYAHKKIWQKLFKANSFAKAYYHNAEPEYAQLLILFGLDDVKQENGTTIINLSDTTTKPTPDLDDVTSPCMKPTRRNLLEEFIPPTDQHSTNEIGAGHGVRFLTRNVFPPNLHLGSSTASKNEGSSSCASSSPTKLWNPFW